MKKFHYQYSLLILSSWQGRTTATTGPQVCSPKNTTEDTYRDFTANIEGQQNVEIRPKVNGFIQKIYVDEGQTVRKDKFFQIRN
jgi:multidrug efflux pump subunit AcrA (membrane-fusion protein)